MAYAIKNYREVTEVRGNELLVIAYFEVHDLGRNEIYDDSRVLGVVSV